MLLKKRTLLLGVALTAFGAVLVSSAFAAQSVNKKSSSSTTIGVTAISAGDLSVVIDGAPETIPADGVDHDAGNIYGIEGDPNYGYSISVPSFDTPGLFSEGCDAEGSAISIADPVSVATTVGLGGTHLLGHLHLKFGIDSDETCTHSGAVVQATFTVVGPN